MLALLFQLQGFSETVTWPCASGFCTLQGPSSMTRPVKLEQPGPPLSQSTTGSLAGSFLLSKNLHVSLRRARVN